MGGQHYRSVVAAVAYLLAGWVMGGRHQLAVCWSPGLFSAVGFMDVSSVRGFSLPSALWISVRHRVFLRRPVSGCPYVVSLRGPQQSCSFPGRPLFPLLEPHCCPLLSFSPLQDVFSQLHLLPFAVWRRPKDGGIISFVCSVTITHRRSAGSSEGVFPP